MKLFILKGFLLLPLILYSQIEKQALFIGNSYTYMNGLPELINQIAISKGNSLIYESHTPGGSTLMQHASNSNVQSLLNATAWNYVILQEQSQNPSFPPSQVASQVYPYAESLCEHIREANPCTEPVFFMTWGRENGDSQNCAAYPPICTYEGMQDRLTESYTEMAQNNESLLAPIGIAWKNIREHQPEINLYSSDGSHPSIQGSYLAACVFYAVLFDDSATNNYTPANLNINEAQLIQTFANNAVNDNETDYNTYPEALADYEIIGENLYLYNQSLHHDTIYWVGISQNITSSEDSLIINLNEFTESYEITLIASNQCFESELLIQINNLKLSTPNNTPIIYPNPSYGILKTNLISADAKTISVYNNLGLLILQDDFKPTMEWDLSHLSNGIYTILLTQKNGQQKSFFWIKKN
ncbi:MAG: SGNH/GDSL hydrolase family protein [Flavobacteriales bacterium]|nr:SGNH/GDSL hydrolase family protein [Flavobacteriales bacterium]